MLAAVHSAASVCPEGWFDATDLFLGKSSVKIRAVELHFSLIHNLELFNTYLILNLLTCYQLSGCLDLDEAYAGELMSWDEGQKHCTDNGANLIQFNSAAEQEQTCM